ncbi:MAG: type I-U CRISPR-associated protein Cas7 [Planctomycetaceae bacterium]|nr:type I-U CRISPR-associated protein Cas7 [Planctomycetaceae bacterium]
MSELTKFDDWFSDKGPAALVIREYLIPVEGGDGVFFPATYAAQQGADRDKEKFQGGYNLDIFPDGSNVCLIDSVGSQANRIEPLFAAGEYADLVPQIVVTFPAQGIRLNLLHANHRAADAIIRCSPFEKELRAAFQEVLRGNAEKLAQFAPTSLVFGVWDSRDTSAKVPRLLASTIRAFNVRGHTRSANFLTQMTVDLAKLDILPGAESKDGFANALASRAPGGIQLMPNGSIRRDVTIGLAALRRLAVLEADGTLSVDRTKSLRRYILGLSLVALTAPQDPYLRQGCNLVPDTDKPREFKVVNLDGTRPDAKLSHEEALKYARAAAKEFKIGKNREEKFDASLAEKAGEVKMETVKVEVTSIDVAGNKFKAKKGSKKLEFSMTSATAITKGDEAATFDSVVKVGTKLDIEHTGGVASKITGQN